MQRVCFGRFAMSAAIANRCHNNDDDDDDDDDRKPMLLESALELETK